MDARETILRRKAKAYYLMKKQEFGIPVTTCADSTVDQTLFKSLELQRLYKKGRDLCCDCSGNFR